MGMFEAPSFLKMRSDVLARPLVNGETNGNIGLAKKFVWVFLEHDKPERTFWPIQYIRMLRYCSPIKMDKYRCIQLG